MGTYEDLKAAIQQVIRTNGNNEITGALLQQTLLSIVNSVGANAAFAGIATPNTNPGTADQNVFYLATEAGTYVNFGGIEINMGEAVILSNKTGNWVKTTSGFATQQQLTELETEIGTLKVINIDNPSASSWQKTNVRVVAGIPYRFTCSVGRISGQRIMDGNSILESLTVNIPAVSSAVITFTQSGELLFYCVDEGEVEVSFYNTTGIKEDVSTLKEDVSTLEEDVSTLKEDVSTLEEDVSTLEEDVSTLKEDVLGNKRILADNGVETSVIVDEYIDTDNTWLGTNGQLGFLDVWFVREYTVEEGNKYQIHSFVYQDKVAIAFHDVNGNVLDYIQGNSPTLASFDAIVIAPKDAVKMYVQGFAQATEGQPNVELLKFILTSPLKWFRKKWVTLGDSLTEFNYRASKNYHDYVAEATGIEVVNMGKSGTGYKRAEDEGLAFYQRIQNVPEDADVITIFGSGNDNLFFTTALLGTASDTGTETVGGCINTTIDNLYEKMPLAVLGIISPTPWIGLTPDKTQSGMTAYCKLLQEICYLRGIPFLDLFHCSGLRPDDATFRELAYSRDEGNGVHPDEVGQKIIAPRFLAFLDSLLLPTL